MEVLILQGKKVLLKLEPKVVEKYGRVFRYNPDIVDTLINL